MKESGPNPRRWRIRIRGLVQGVGFRPHVYRQAQRHGVVGFALNDGEGVLIEAQGRALDAFVHTVEHELPPLARVDQLTRAEIPVENDDSFRIRSSDQEGVATAAIPADVALCEACLSELFDPADRRHLHPFIACSHCGPRVTMTRRLPYDRVNTTMAGFELCDPCRDEYTDPASRRFHAEPIACHDCGPTLSHSIAEIAEAVGLGRFVAIKGIGGYHLVTDARRGDWVQELRARKHRDQKPFAVMVLNVASAGRHVALSSKAKESLTGIQRPVVVAPRRPEADEPLPDAVSPGLDSLGLMLPYTSVHYLLFHALLGYPKGTDWLDAPNELALIFTSANESGRPLVARRQDAEEELAGIADLLVHHDRTISRSMDDSVVRSIGDRIVPIRRSRGWVPDAITLGEEAPVVVACGAHLKNTVTVTRGQLAYPSTHVGDLETPASIGYQADAVEQLIDMLGVEPERIACDWHPDYASTRLAERLAARFGADLVPVQHHHAHIAAVLAEHNHEGPALGLALDGHGQGVDGQAWGGELLQVDGARFLRLGHFRPIPAVGGDRAAREPWRLAAGVLNQLGRGHEITTRFSGQPLAEAVHSVLKAGGAPETSAAGRMFDAASALLGVCRVASFEGQAPMLLETCVRQPRVLDDGYSIDDGVLDFSPLLNALADASSIGQGADWLHGTLVAGLVDWACRAAEQTGIRTVALGGGCMINRYLASALPEKLADRGLRVLTARRMPPNDAAISLGQAWAATRLGPADRAAADQSETAGGTRPAGLAVTS